LLLLLGVSIEVEGCVCSLQVGGRKALIGAGEERVVHGGGEEQMAKQDGFLNESRLLAIHKQQTGGSV